MKNKKTKLNALLLFGVGLTGVHAQEALPASGGNASGSGGSVSYTIGQVVYTTITGINGSVAQGIQQPYEISVVTGLEEAIGINLIYSTFPNPAKEYVTLRIENCDTENITYQLYDDSGKLLERKKAEGIETRIDMGNLVIATYILKVLRNNQVVKTFKVIKY
jgi:hypothetical protein